MAESNLCFFLQREFIYCMRDNRCVDGCQQCAAFRSRRDRMSSAPFSLLISCLACLSSEFPEIPNCRSVARWSIDAHARHQACRRSCLLAVNRCRARSFSGRREIDRVRALTRRTPSNVSFLTRTHFRSPSCHRSLTSPGLGQRDSSAS